MSEFNFNFFIPALPARADIYNLKILSEVQKADFGVCSLLIAAYQHDIDTIKFKEILDHHKIIPKTSSQLIESFEKFKDELKNRLEKFGNSHNFPTLMDIDYEIQHKTIPVDDLTFKLILKGFDHVKNEKVIIEEFNCNLEELQLLISKFKDIERQCDKISRFE